MLIEVYAGAKPGRPRLLLLLTAGLLTGALGLAWVQVKQAHTFGPEQRVDDTPLWVRLPRDWHRHPQDPRAFILPVREDGKRRERYSFERLLRFEFDRLPAFVSVDELLHRSGLDDPLTRASLTRARIGKYDAVEVHIGPVIIGRRVSKRETLLRFTCLPRGHLIKVVYEALDSLRPADLEIMEEVCASLRVDEPTLSGPPQEYVQRAGLTLPLQDGWHVVGSDLVDVPGLYIGGSVDDAPAWSIAIFRTWLAAGRRPQDLLADFAAENWLLWDVEERLHETRRDDGATVTSLKQYEFGDKNERIQSAWVVAQSPSLAAMLFVYAGREHAAVADEAAGKIAAALQFSALDAWLPLGPAEEAGKTLAATLAKRGPLPRWGRESIQAVYAGETLGHSEEVRVKREAIGRDPERGYEGTQIRRIASNQEEMIRWSVDGRAAAYQWQVDFFYNSSPVTVHEERSSAAGDVVREIHQEQRRLRRWTFRPGLAFVSPPAEDIVAGWVARNEAPAAIIETSTLLGASTDRLLLRYLAPDGDHPRVLIQEDYWPLGRVAAFDDARAVTQYEISPTSRFRRVE